jgi:two-component system, LytTR family, response regulator
VSNTHVSDPGIVLRTLVVDDEKLARAGLRAMLAHDPDLAVEECAGGREAVRIIRDSAGDAPVDLVFLDVRMPAMDGFDVIGAVGTDRMPVVVFTTAYSDYAIHAFEACALDYLLKPVREARLTQAVERAKAAVRQRRVGELSERLVALVSRWPETRLPAHEAEPVGAESSLPIGRVLLRSGTTSYYVDADDIDWIEADTYYARIWTGVRSHLLRQSLAQLETQLDSHQFVRVHRSAIVNVRMVREIGRVGLGKYCVRLHDGRQIPVSRDRRRALHSALRASAPPRVR